MTKKNKVKTKGKPPVEIRPHANGQAWIDEVVAEDVSMVHVEQMTIDSFWVGIYFKDCPNVRVVCNFEVGDIAKDEEGKETRELRLRANKEEI